MYVGHFGHVKGNRKGFTLIELLVVIAIIALLSTLAVVSLNSARARARDVNRIAFFTNLKTALEVVAASKNQYPIAPGVNLGAGVAGCLDTDGFKATGSSCSAQAPMPQIQGDPTNSAPYVYKYYAFQDPTTTSACDANTKCAHYMITFSLEGDAGSYKKGWNCSTEKFSASKSVATTFPDTDTTGPTALADCN
ncbi:type II secretion system protein [Candidatus Uhrbacteria bacterium]|nr:type II secretion system protein [Candidatus Uhrbacteria bacterium]